MKRYMTLLDEMHYGFGISDPTFLKTPDDTVPISYNIHMPCGGTTSSVYVVGKLVWNTKECAFDFQSIGWSWLEVVRSPKIATLVLKFAAEKAEVLRDHYQEERERWLKSVTQYAIF